MTNYPFHSPPFLRTSTDVFYDIPNQDLDRLITAASTALRNRGYRTPPIPYPPPQYNPPVPPVTPFFPRPPTMIPPPPRQIQPPPPPQPNGTNLPAQTTATDTPSALKNNLPPPRPSDMWENAKVEHIICAGLKTTYDGSPNNLLPTLNLIHVRGTNEVWYPATFALQETETIDLILNFSKVKETTVLNQAKRLWDASNASLQSHTRGTDTNNNRLFGVFLMNSITPDLAATLHRCQNVHRTHLAFVESIKQKIRRATLGDFNNEIPRYLRFLKDNLKLISSTGAADDAHNDLIPHLLLQLRATTIPTFQQAVLKWQRDYFEGVLTLTPSNLVTKVDNECQILTHAGQWVETIDPSIIAMQASVASHESYCSTKLIQGNLQHPKT
jgi:hypothetical protein